MAASRPKIYVFACIAVALWGLSFLWTNQLLEYNVPVFTLICTRMVVAGFFLFAFGVLFKKLQRLHKEDVKWVLMMAFMEPFLYFIGETFGMKLTASPNISSVIVSSIPIFALLGGILFFKERPSLLNMVGILVTLPGLCLVVFGKWGLTSSASFETPRATLWAGIALLFLAVFSAVGYSIIVKKISAKYNAYTITTWQMSLGALYFLPFMCFIDIPENPLMGFISDILFWKPIFMLSILCSCVAFVLFITVIKELGVTRTNIFDALIPIVTLAACLLMGVETISWWQGVGVVVVVCGVILAQWKKA